MPRLVQLKERIVEPPPRCPRCGHDLTMPALNPQQLIAALVLWQSAQTPIFQWSAEELDALEAALEQGDLFTRLFANSVTIRRRSGIEIKWERGRGTKPDHKKENANVNERA